MAIKVDKQVVIDGEDYQYISSALELTRRYISKHKRGDRAVDEFSPKEIAQIEGAMERLWN